MSGTSLNTKILLLIPSMATVGGTERMVDALSRLLRSGNLEPIQATFDSPDSPRFFEGPTPIYKLGPIPRLPLPLRPLSYALAAWRLRAVKKKLGINVTISNLWGADLISVLSGGLDKKISLCHINVVGNVSNKLMIRFLPIVAAIYRRFDRVVAVSESLADELQHLYKLGHDRITHIDNFVDRPKSEPRWNPRDGICRFVWCGRFSHEKNVAGLLKVWSRFVPGRTGVQLVLVGDGPQNRDLRSLATELELRIGTSTDEASSHVIFVGRSADPASYMLGARALLLSSHAEGLPIVLLEALALGVPVLAADCPAGGVRTALLGDGTVDPDRRDIVYSPAGLLLPVPVEDRPQTIGLWLEALATACDDEQRVRSWRSGALSRASRFGSDIARQKWLAILSDK